MTRIFFPLLALLACGDGPDAIRRADLTLLYSFDGLTCEDAGVEEIDVFVTGIAFGEGIAETFFCDEAPEGITVPGLRAEFYEVRISGYSPDEILLYDTVTEIRVDRTVTYEIDVPFTVGDLALTWRFGTLPTCGPVSFVDVRLVDPFGIVVDDAVYDCSAGGLLYRDLQTGIWTVRLTGRDLLGEVRYRSGTEAVAVLADEESRYTIPLAAVAP